MVGYLAHLGPQWHRRGGGSGQGRSPDLPCRRLLARSHPRRHWTGRSKRGRPLPLAEEQLARSQGHWIRRVWRHHAPAAPACSADVTGGRAAAPGRSHRCRPRPWPPHQRQDPFPPSVRQTQRAGEAAAALLCERGSGLSVRALPGPLQRRCRCYRWRWLSCCRRRRCSHRSLLRACVARPRVPPAVKLPSQTPAPPPRSLRGAPGLATRPMGSAALRCRHQQGRPPPPLTTPRPLLAPPQPLWHRVRRSSRPPPHLRRHRLPGTSPPARRPAFPSRGASVACRGDHRAE